LFSAAVIQKESDRVIGDPSLGQPPSDEALKQCSWTDADRTRGTIGDISPACQHAAQPPWESEVWLLPDPYATLRRV